MDDEERRLRRAAVTRAMQAPPEVEPVEAGPDRPEQPDEEDAAARRFEQRTLWLDLQVRRAIARGDFDNLPGTGKPLKLTDAHDPDWWVKQLVEREKISGVLPPALMLRKEDAELDATLDRETSEHEVRRIVEDFNRRVVEARRQLQGGPPVITPTRDVDVQVAAWRARREERRRQHQVPAQTSRTSQRRPGWWARRRRRTG